MPVRMPLRIPRGRVRREAMTLFDGLDIGAAVQRLPVNLTAPEDHRLPRSHLVLAILQARREWAQREGQGRPCPLTAIQDRLSREHPGEVQRIYDALMVGDAEGPSPEGSGKHGLLAERMKELRRPLPTRQKQGMTLRDIAAMAGLERETLAAMMEHHEYLELVPYGGTQRRRLVTERADRAGLGHNADGSRRRIALLEGIGRAVVFPVFYPEKVPDILWSLDHSGITAGAAAIQRKRERMRWLLQHHGYLPDAELAKLSGYTVRGVEKARQPSGQHRANK